MMSRLLKGALLCCLIAGWALGDLYVIGTLIPHDHAGWVSRVGLAVLAAFYNVILTAFVAIAFTDLLSDGTGGAMTEMHGHAHHEKHRRLTIGLLVFWLTQVAMWVCLLIGAFVVPSLRDLFERVYWVSILSLYANLTTVVSIVAALWAALAAGSAHEDSETTRAVLQLDMAQLDADLRHLANLQPGVEAHQLARRIGERLKGHP